VATVGWLVLALGGIGAIVWGADAFAEHLVAAATRLGVSAFALAVLLAGAEPEELATAVTAAWRGAPAIVLGDVIGANVALCLVAVGVGAVLMPLPLDRRVRRFVAMGVAAAGLAAVLAWDGVVTRAEGAALVAAYMAFVATIWLVERRPPELGEVSELAEALEEAASAARDGAAASGPGAGRRRAGQEVALLLAGVAAMAVGASVLVEAIRRVSDAEATQGRMGLAVVGFATAFEMVVLAWSSARRGVVGAVMAGVAGSYTYNVTMTLGAGALVRPLQVVDVGLLRGPWLALLAAPVAMVALAAVGRGRIGRLGGVVLLAAYPLFVAGVLLVG